MPLRFFFYLFFLCVSIQLSAQITERNCEGTIEYYYREKQEALEAFTKEWIEGSINTRNLGRINIPVVVHIVYQSEAENISDEQIHSQIAALNRDFHLENDNLDKVHPEFKDRIGKVGFTFCLASTDPNGNPTTGITRKRTLETNIFNGEVPWIYYSNRGGKDAWNTEEYLNIWVTKTSNSLGFGSKPYQNKLEEDGVVVHPEVFGTVGNLDPNYNLGRTTVHEIGHYFNLFHPFVGFDCGDDYVADTPTQSDPYFGCPDINASSCDSRDITANFMNYANDECLAMFTVGQTKRMQAALINARAGLLSSNGCELPPIGNNPVEKIRVYPNPASYFFCVETGDIGLNPVIMKIIDSKGATVGKEMSLSENHLEIIRPQHDGIYFLQFMIEGEPTITKKVFIKR